MSIIITKKKYLNFTKFHRSILPNINSYNYKIILLDTFSLVTNMYTPLPCIDDVYPEQLNNAYKKKKQRCGYERKNILLVRRVRIEDHEASKR